MPPTGGIRSLAKRIYKSRLTATGQAPACAGVVCIVSLVIIL